MLGAMCVSLGDVLHLQCTLCDPPKPKFFVVAQVQPLRMFLINSNLTEFQKRSNDHLAVCPGLLADDHPQFLTHDSFLCCDHLSHEYNYEQVAQKLQKQPEVLIGHLHADAKAALCAALDNNRLLAGKHLRELRPLWQPFARVV